MIDPIDLKVQLTRLLAIPKWPGRDTPEGKAMRHELKRALATCDSLETATRVVDELIRTCQGAPAPALVYDLAMRMRSESVNPEREGCAKCGATGWLVIPGRGAVRCSCMPPLVLDEKQKHQPQEQRGAAGLQHVSAVAAGKVF